MGDDVRNAHCGADSSTVGSSGVQTGYEVGRAGASGQRRLWGQLMTSTNLSQASSRIKFDLNLIQASISEMQERVEQARSAGYDGIFVAETRQDPFLPLAAAAGSGAAEGLDLGTSIALAFPRSPMVTALSAWGLHRDHGRFVLGLGSQVRKHIQRRFSCTYSEPSERLAEYVHAVRHIWGAFQGEHPLDFHGRFYTLDFLPEFVNPGPIAGPPPEIYLATVGKRMYRTAGEVADGVFVHPLHTVGYLTDVAIPAMRDGVQAPAASTSGVPAISATVFAVVGAGDEARKAEQEVRTWLAFYASTPTYRDVLAHAGWEHVGEKLTQMVRSGEHSAMPAVVPDAMLDDFCVRAETWTEASILVRQRYQGVADRISFYNPPSAGVQIA